MVGIDIFTNEKDEDTCPSTHNMDVPNIKSYQLLNITEGYVTLMSDNGDIREDLRIPDKDVSQEIGFKHENEFMVTVISAMGEESAIATKVLGK